MHKLTKDTYMQSQARIIAGLLHHASDNLDNTIFEDEKELKSLMETVLLGCNSIVAVMNAIVERKNKRSCGYC